MLIVVLIMEEKDRVYDNINADTDHIKMQNSDNNINSRNYSTLAIVVSVIGFTCLLIVLILFLKSYKSIGILRISARPLKNIPNLLLIPLF